MRVQLVESEKTHPVIAIKNARVGDFNGKNLSTIGATLINMNSDEPAARNLRDWYDDMQSLAQC